MRVRPLAIVTASLVLGGTTLACGLLTNVDYDRVVVHGDGGASSSGTSGPGSSGTTSSSSSSSSGGAGCADGLVECLGQGTIACCPAPGDPGLPAFLAAGGSNTCAISTAGQIKCWGANGNGQLGRGSLTPGGISNVPLLVQRIPGGATQLTVGGNYVCAVVGGIFTCWGGNAMGQFGNDSTDGSPLPIPIGLPAAPTTIAAGTATTCAALGASGYCWGDNTATQVGVPSGNRVITPTLVQGLPGLTATPGIIGVAAAHACANAAGKLYCWGTNELQRLGQSGPTQSASAIAVTNGAVTVVELTLGQDHSCARLADGSLRCWGSNIYGELSDDAVPTQSDGAIIPTAGDNLVQSVCAGYQHTCIVKSGSVLCSGGNASGQVGIVQEGVRGFTAVGGLTAFEAKQVVCGDFHTCALSTAGEIRCWGEGSSGQRGDGTSAKSFVPGTVKWGP